jgi:hypothetical protein
VTLSGHEAFCRFGTRSGSDFRRSRDHVGSGWRLFLGSYDRCRWFVVGVEWRVDFETGLVDHLLLKRVIFIEGVVVPIPVVVGADAV